MYEYEKQAVRVMFLQNGDLSVLKNEESIKQRDTNGLVICMLAPP